MHSHGGNGGEDGGSDGGGGGGKGADPGRNGGNGGKLGGLTVQKKKWLLIYASLQGTFPGTHHDSSYPSHISGGHPE